jgi:cytochrome c heme-lyase
MAIEKHSVQGWQPDEQDMGNVVRIHNVVNEQAWRHVLHWEQLHARDCNCPKLKRFEGRPKDYSPRALMLNAVGYKLPFDRHDWYVDRCGQEVRYVIDFYNATGSGAAGGMFLDVRPALDSPGAVIDRLRMSAIQWLHWW